MQTDPIADMLTRIRNAQRVNKRTVDVPYSYIKFEIAKVLKTHRFVSDVELNDNTITLTLIKDRIADLQRVSRPGQRIFSKAHNLETNFKQGYGRVIVSTPQGVLESRTARNQKVGGEVLCKVW